MKDLAAISLIEIQGPDQGFKGVGQDVLAGLPLPVLRFPVGQVEVLVQAVPVGDFRKHPGIHQGGPPIGHLPLRIRVTAVEAVGYDQFQDGITQELQPFVVAERETGVLVQVGPVDEGLSQDVPIFERNPQLPFQTGKILLLVHSQACPDSSGPSFAAGTPSGTAEFSLIGLSTRSMAFSSPLATISL